MNWPLENLNEKRQLNTLEQTLGVQFAEKDLLELALVHSSYLNENPEDYPESNERLEFLGDALIGLVIAHRLYRAHPDVLEGGLTAMRSTLVRGETLADVARSLGLGGYLLLGAGEDAGGGRERPSNLAAVFEALVGALLLDQGYRTVEAFVLRALSEQLEALDRQPVVNSPKSMLQELVQGRNLDAPTYRVVDATGQDHAREFTAEVIVDGRVTGRGTGHRKAAAEQQAAKEALKALDQDI